MATAKQKKLIHRSKSESGDGVQVSSDNYKSDLVRALNHYNTIADDKEKKEWFIKYIAAQDKKLATALSKVDEYHFRHAGVLVRLLDGGTVLQEKEQQFLQERTEYLTKLAGAHRTKTKPTEVSHVATVSIQQRMDDKAHELAGEIEGAIDEFIVNKSTDFSTRGYLTSKQVTAPIAKRIGEFFVGRRDELYEALAGEDKQLVEGYSNFTKRELKKFAEFMSSIVDDCSQMVQTAKATRAPRAKKAVNPAKLVSKMKYMKEFSELKLKSINPIQVLACTELWVYNTKYRKLQVYRAEYGNLSVKGTTIVGYSLKDSQSMTLRKPDEFFKNTSIGKRALNGSVKKLTTKPSTPNGRINEECVLLGAF